MVTLKGTLYPTGSYQSHYTASVPITDRGLPFVVDNDEIAALFADEARPSGTIREGFDRDYLPDGTTREFRYRMLARSGMPLLLDENAWKIFQRDIAMLTLRVELEPTPPAPTLPTPASEVVIDEQAA